MPSIEISSRSGNVQVTAEARNDVLVERGKHSYYDGTVRVEARSGAVIVRCPLRTDARIGSASGAVECRGELGDVWVTSASGHVEIEHARNADIRCSSGSAALERCDDTCQLTVSSGSVRVGRAGHVAASARSGKVEVGPVDSAEVRVASGNVTLAATGEDDVAITTRSGSVLVTVPRGARPNLDIESSGPASCEVPVGDDFRIVVRARSGKVTVKEG